MCRVGVQTQDLRRRASTVRRCRRREEWERERRGGLKLIKRAGRRGERSDIQARFGVMNWAHIRYATVSLSLSLYTEVCGQTGDQLMLSFHTWLSAGRRNYTTATRSGGFLGKTNNTCRLPLLTFLYGTELFLYDVTTTSGILFLRARRRCGLHECVSCFECLIDEEEPRSVGKGKSIRSTINRLIPFAVREV